MRALAKACKARGTSFIAFASVLEGLLGVAAETPDVLAIDARCDEAKLADVVRALRRTEKMQNVAVVVYDAEVDEVLCARQARRHVRGAAGQDGRRGPGGRRASRYGLGTPVGEEVVVTAGAVPRSDRG